MQKSKLKVIEPDESFYANHLTFTSVSDIQQIACCLNEIAISYFTFDRTYKDGSHIRLTNAGKWIESYYRKKLYDAAIFEKDPKLFSSGYVFWSWLKREPIYSAAGEHNIDHGLTITQPHELYCDFFHFGTTRDNFISPEVLAARLPQLYRFIAYFKERAQRLIAQAEATRFILPIKSLTHINLHDLQIQDDALDVLAKTEITRLYLGDEFDNAYLTRKEIEVLSMLKKGSKTVDIINQFNLSERTVETHIKNIKAKFKCHTLFELGYVTGRLGVQNIFPFTVDIEDTLGDKNGTVA